MKRFISGLILLACLIFPVASRAQVPFGSFGVVSAGADGVSLAAAITFANQTNCACKIVMGQGYYYLTSQQLLSANGIWLAGNGADSTRIVINDAGGMAGADAVVVNSALGVKITGLTFMAVAPRTAGSYVTVKGKNNITANPAQPTNQLTMDDVNMQGGFWGLRTVDGPTGAGAWGTRVNGGTWINFSAGGVGARLESTHGGQTFLNDIKMYNGTGIADASRAFAGVEYRGGNDLEINNINTIYFQHGIVIDPPTGNVANVTIMRACEFDGNTQESVLVTQVNGGSITGVQMLGGWVNSTNDAVHATISLVNGISMQFIGVMNWNGYVGFLFKFATNVVVDACDMSGNVYGAFMQAGNSHIKIVNSFVNPKDGNTPTFGIDITGGDNYIITGNDTLGAGTGINNAPGTSATRVVANNI